MSATTQSLWHETTPPAPPTAPLHKDAIADIAIVGAGFTGLVAALTAAEAGARVIVLEAGGIGHGASGRNGGQVIPGFKLYPSELRAALGPERGARAARFGAAAADRVFDLIQRYQIACHAERRGWLQPAHTRGRLPMLRQRMEDWREDGADVAWLDAPAIAAAIGSSAYHGGWIDRRGGSIHPLAYAHGLAAAALARGVAIHTNTAVTTLETDPGFMLRTSHGCVRADRVIIATNGYTDRLLPGLAQSLVALDSAQIATSPLPDDLRAAILPGASAASDSRRSLLYFRLSPDGRFVIGGRGGILGATSAVHWDRLQRAAERLFPGLRGLSWTHRWAGRVAMTRDHLPHLDEPQPGLLIGLGYNGRGIAMASSMGAVLAQRALGAATESLPLPLGPLAKLPFPMMRRPLAAGLVAWATLRDRIEEGAG